MPTTSLMAPLLKL